VTTDSFDNPKAFTLTRRAWLGGAGALALSLGASDLAWGAGLVAVRVWPATDYTRVTLESDTPLAAKHSLVDNPPRLVIDISGLELSPALRDLVGKVRADDPFIGGVRVGQNQPKVVRLVIDLKQDVKPQVFSLEPVAAYQHRLVFDLYPRHAPDPMAALDNTRRPLPPSSASTASGVAAAPDGGEDRAAPMAEAPSQSDSLGDFIGGLGSRKPGAPAVTKSNKSGSAPNVAKAASAPELAANGAASREPRTERLMIVTIDPGHGGEDPGAIGPSGLQEKQVVLSIAQRLRERLEVHPNVRVLLTRDSDFFVPLRERVTKARNVQADLFVSIHADAFMNHQARGASVFALSDSGASSAAARWLAQKENAADLVGGVNIKAKDKAVLRTLLDMSTTAQIKDSLKLGNEILGRMGKVGRLHRGKVEQAGFAVLKAPDIPSILVETGFISNPDEEAKLADSAYQDRIADALLTGVMHYFAKHPPMRRERSI
jgi:N-acetylmuramoyl-L-alanine amidase